MFKKFKNRKQKEVISSLYRWLMSLLYSYVVVQLLKKKALFTLFLLLLFSDGISSHAEKEKLSNFMFFLRVFVIMTVDI